MSVEEPIQVPAHDNNRFPEFVIVSTSYTWFIFIFSLSCENRAWASDFPIEFTTIHLTEQWYCEERWKANVCTVRKSVRAENSRHKLKRLLLWAANVGRKICRKIEWKNIERLVPVNDLLPALGMWFDDFQIKCNKNRISVCRAHRRTTARKWCTRENVNNRSRSFLFTSSCTIRINRK